MTSCGWLRWTVGKVSLKIVRINFTQLAETYNEGGLTSGTSMTPSKKIHELSDALIEAFLHTWLVSADNETPLNSSLVGKSRSVHNKTKRCIVPRVWRICACMCMFNLAAPKGLRVHLQVIPGIRHLILFDIVFCSRLQMSIRLARAKNDVKKNQVPDPWNDIVF